MREILADLDRTTLPSFEGLSEQSPVSVESFTQITNEAATEITARYRRHGVCFLRAEDGEVADTAVAVVAEALDLGALFIPALYRTETALRGGVAVMCAQDQPVRAMHPSFDTTSGQPLHTDGTLDAIGEVKSSLLLCAQPAERGGATFFLNTTAIVAALADTDPAAARALLRPDVLVRISNLPDTGRSISTGPALDQVGGQLRTRLSLTATDTWQIPDNEDGLALLRALATIIRIKHEHDPRYYVERTLTAGTGVLFANDKIGHGRYEFTNTPTRTRRVVRALFGRTPRAPIAATTSTTAMSLELAR